MTQPDETPILDASGQPARRRAATHCPKCGATPELRVASGGFGAHVRDVCSRCGYQFDERTVWPRAKGEGT
jgi:transposase-like protein